MPPLLSDAGDDGADVGATRAPLVQVHQADVSRCTDPTTEPDPYVIVTVLDDTVKGLTPQRTHM
jgi:hypothetical protein